MARLLVGREEGCEKNTMNKLALFRPILAQKEIALAFFIFDFCFLVKREAIRGF